MSYLPGQIVWSFDLEAPIINYSLMQQIPAIVPKELEHLPVKPNEYVMLAFARDGKPVLLGNTTHFDDPSKAYPNNIWTGGGRKLKTNEQITAAIDEATQLLVEKKIVLGQTREEYDAWVARRKQERDEFLASRKTL